MGRGGRGRGGEKGREKGKGRGEREAKEEEGEGQTSEWCRQKSWPAAGWNQLQEEVDRDDPRQRKQAVRGGVAKPVPVEQQCPESCDHLGKCHFCFLSCAPTIGLLESAVAPSSFMNPRAVFHNGLPIYNPDGVWHLHILPSTCQLVRDISLPNGCYLKTFRAHIWKGSNMN